MYKFSGLKTALTGLALCFASALASAGAVLKTDATTGKLTGATDVLVDGNFYSVEFVEGTCAKVYGICSPGSFITNDVTQARKFSQALLDQVLLGSFDDDPTLTYGCAQFNNPFCNVNTAYGYSTSNQQTPLQITAARNHRAGGQYGDSVAPGVMSLNLDVTFTPWSVWARWSPQPASSVPEPTSLALLAAAGAALTWSQRRRREVKVAE